MTNGVGDSPDPDGGAGLQRKPVIEPGAGDEMKDLLERVLVPLVRVSGACAAEVRTLNDVGAPMHLLGSVGLPVWRSSMPGLPAAEGDARRPRDEVVDRSGTECRQLLAIPLQHRARVLGVCNLYFAGKGKPAADVVDVLESFGELIGSVLHHARHERQRVQAAVDSERRAIAADLHDSVAQTLAFLKLRMPLLHDAIECHDEATALRYWADVRRAIGEAHAGVRSLLTSFRAAANPLGLHHALQAGIDAFETSTGIKLALHDRAQGLALSSTQETELLRIVLEALSNIARHAGARHTWLTIEQRSGLVEILVEDDGCGVPIEPGAPEARHGIEIMRQRAAKLGGQLEIDQRPGGGTRVSVRVPTVLPAGATA